jgi:phenylacetate-CoA ligase
VTARHGVIAYETSLPDGSLNDGMIVNEGVYLEVVRIGTDTPAPVGEIGEIVITRANADLPQLRVATGDLSRILPGASACGRTATRIAGWLGRVSEATRVANRLVLPTHALDLLRRYATLESAQLIVRRDDGRDVLTLRAYAPTASRDELEKIRIEASDAIGLDVRLETDAVDLKDRSARLVVDERP